MAKSKSPPRFSYTVSDPVHFGVFIWDGTSGAATYLQDRTSGVTVQRGMSCMDPCQYTKNGKKYPFWHFTETTPGPDGRTRLWLFEIPKPEQKFCAIYFYSAGDQEPQLFGDAVHQEGRSRHPPLV
jgi:hypothetical protein